MRTPLRTVRGLVQQRSARGLDPGCRCVHVRGGGHVDLQVEALSLDPVPAQRAVILIENDAAIACRDDGAGELPAFSYVRATVKPTASRQKRIEASTFLQVIEQLSWVALIVAVVSSMVFSNGVI